MEYNLLLYTIYVGTKNVGLGVYYVIGNYILKNNIYLYTLIVWIITPKYKMILVNLYKLKISYKKINYVSV